MKRTITDALALLPILALTALLLGACQNSSGPIGNNRDVINTGTGSLSGKVVTQNNVPLPGVAVSAGTVTAYTNSKGEFYLPNAPAGDRVPVDFRLDGYVSTQKLAFIRNSATGWVEASLLPVGTTRTINAVSGGSVAFGGAQVNFPPAALVDSKGNPFTGSAQVKATWFDPTGQQFYGCFPGEFAGVRTDNSRTGIESFGFVDVEISSGTEKLQLASGQQANVTFPIPAALQARAPQSIPLWYYDESKGQWIEEGSATRSGNNYVGAVKHFSKWNADMPNQTSYLEGRVVDKNGNPIALSAVHSTGIDYTGSSTVHTDDQGVFKLPVKSAANARVWASYYIISSPTQDIATPATGQTLNIGTIVVPLDTADFCTITGRLVDNGNLPVTGISVQLKDASGKVLDYVATNKDGRFKFFGEAGKHYTVVVNTYFDSTQTTKSVDVDCPVQPGTVDVGDIKLDIGGATLTGRVVDASGNPMPNVYLYTNPGNRSGDPNGGKGMITGADGRFSLWVRPAISMQINFYYMQSVKKTITVTTPALGQTQDLGDIALP